MKRWSACLTVATLCFATLWAAPGVARAKDGFCTKLEEELKDKVFVAKVPLYDTEIGYDMIYHLERDADEISEGEELTVVDVSCGSKAIEMSLRPQRKGEKVEIKFFLSSRERVASDARERLDHMMGYVFEREETEE